MPQAGGLFPPPRIIPDPSRCVAQLLCQKAVLSHGSGTKCSRVMKCIIKFQLSASSLMLVLLPLNTLLLHPFALIVAQSAGLEHPAWIIRDHNHCCCTKINSIWLVYLTGDHCRGHLLQLSKIRQGSEFLMSEVHSVPSNQAPEEVHSSDKHNI